MRKIFQKMKAIAIPDTTYRLLEAIRQTNGTSPKVAVQKVVITGSEFQYFPAKSKFVSEAIRRAGLSDQVQRYQFPLTRHEVEGCFRRGAYDVGGAEILIIR